MSQDRFVLEKKVGEGGMGEVFLARDLETGRKVALKIVLSEGSSATGSDRLVERFFGECVMLASLRHPHIVRYVAHGRLSTGAPFLAMQWLEGVDLGARLEEERLSLNDALTIAAAVADALDFAHGRGIVHRDLKPQNLFLVEGEAALVQVLDFGVARAPGGSGTQPGTAIGTPGYMAPEQIRGLPTVGPSADVYSLGAVLFEMVAGRPPFLGSDPLALLGKVMLEEAPSLAQVTDGLPSELVDLVASMLAKDPARRPENGGAVRAALAALPAATAARDLEPPPPSLTTTEHVVVPVVLVRDPGLAAGRAPILDPTEVRASLGAVGGQLLSVSDGYVVSIELALGVPDRMVMAARAALALRTRVPDARLAVGAASMRASALSDGDLNGLRAVMEATLDPRIVVDELAAGLLDPWFVIGRAGRARVLERERDAEGVRRLLGHEIPFVGRGPELAAIEALFREAVALPSARVAVVRGEAGIGKTRLRQELVQRLDGFEVWVGRADPARARSPFGLVASVVADAAWMRPLEAMESRRGRLRSLAARVGLGEEDGARVAEFLGEVVGCPFEPSVQLRAARRDPQLKHDQLRRAFEDLVAAAVAERPLLMILEDLHWADAGSMHLLHAALRHAARAPLMVLAMARPEVTTSLGRPFSDLTPLEIPLLPLTATDAARIVQTVMPSVAVETAQRLVATASGHPLHLEELIRAHALGTGADTAKVMLGARLASLPTEARRVLRAASVVGPTFSSTLVRAQCPDLSEATLRAILGTLVREELIVPTGQGLRLDDIGLSFTTTLLRDAAYDMLTERDRVVGHFLVASALSQRPDSDPLSLAEHWVAAGDPARAASGFLRAAEHTLDGNDVEGALDLVSRGLAGDDTSPLAGALETTAARIHRWRSANPDMSAAAERALALLPEGSGLWFEALGDAAVAAGRLGRIESLEAHANTLLAARADEDATSALDAKLLSLCRISVELRHAGRREAADAALAALSEGEARFASEPVLAATRAHAHAVPALIAGDLESAYRLLSAAAAAFGDAGDLRHQCLELSNAGFVMVELGVPDRAEPALRSALESARRISVASVEVGAQATLALALVRLGRLDEARTEAARATAQARAAGNGRLEGAALLYGALAEVAAGAHDAAAQLVERALDAFTAAPSYRAYVLGVRARLSLRRGELAEAGHAAREAMGTLGRLGGIEAGEALVRLAFVEVLSAEGRSGDSLRARAIARERVLERASRITDGELRARFLAIPEHHETLYGSG